MSNKRRSGAINTRKCLNKYIMFLKERPHFFSNLITIWTNNQTRQWKRYEVGDFIEAKRLKFAYMS